MASTNRGVAPADPTSPTGALRYTIGDTDYEPLTPPETGYGDYANFSDNELAAFLTRGGDSITRASGFAYLRFAALAAAGAISWKSDDLSVDSKQVASEFRLLSRIAFEQADAEDSAGVSGFDLDFPFSTCGCTDWCTHDAELEATTNPYAAPIYEDTSGDLDGGTP